MVAPPAKSVCYNHLSSWFMLYLYIVFHEFSDPSRLASCQLLGLLEIGEVLVVGENYRFVRRSVNEVSPLPYAEDYCQELSIVSHIVPFGRRMCLRKLRDRVFLSVRIVLE